jgi:hypothetical protein
MSLKDYLKEQEELSENYEKDTIKYIDSLIKDATDKKLLKFLKGLREYLDENGYLTPNQKQALGNITNKQ